MPQLKVYTKGTADDEEILKRLRRLRVNFDVKPLEGQFLQQASEYERITGESSSPLFCVNFEDGSSRCTLKFNDIKRAVREGLL